MELTKMGHTLINEDYESLAYFIHGNEVRECLENTFKNPLQGWYYKIILTENDDYFCFGPANNHTMTMAEYEGKAVCLAKFPAYNLYDDFNSDLVFNELESEDQYNFMKILCEEFKEYDEVKEAIENGEELNYCDYTRINCDKVDTLLSQCFPSIYQGALNEYKDDIINLNVEIILDQASDQLTNYQVKLEHYDNEIGFEM